MCFLRRFAVFAESFPKYDISRNRRADIVGLSAPANWPGVLPAHVAALIISRRQLAPYSVLSGGRGGEREREREREVTNGVRALSTFTTAGGIRGRHTVSHKLSADNVPITLDTAISAPTLRLSFSPSLSIQTTEPIQRSASRTGASSRRVVVVVAAAAAAIVEFP